MSRLTPERRVVAKVLEGHERRPGRVDRSLRKGLAGLEQRDVARAWSLAYTLLRNQTLLQRTVEPLLRKPFRAQERGARIALLLGACEILLMESVPDRAAVDQAVEVARLLGASRSCGFVNATLRRLARDRPEPVTPPRSEDPVGWAEIARSHPRWILDRMAALVGDGEAADWADVANAEPPLVLRARSDDAGDVGTPGLVPGAIRVERPEGGVRGIPGWGEGRFWVQDEGAQAAGLLMAARPGMRVLDACAAPGAPRTAPPLSRYRPRPAIRRAALRATRPHEGSRLAL